MGKIASNYFSPQRFVEAGLDIEFVEDNEEEDGCHLVVRVEVDMDTELKLKNH